MTSASFLLGYPVAILQVLLLGVIKETGRGGYDTPQTLHLTYDFVVVGSGSAGSVVAARLAEEGWRILLLEAGDEPPPQSYVPGLQPSLFFGDVNWHYLIEPQKHTMFGYVNRRNEFACGRVAGGTSTINGMIYTRGNRKDYDNWARMGNSGWDYNTVLKYFKRSEDYHGHHIINPESEIYHGYGGPMQVEAKQWSTPLAEAFLKAGQELGYNINDHNAAQQVGFSPIDHTTRNGVRESTAEAFLRPANTRENFHLLLNAYATKVLFNNGVERKAVGVEFYHSGEPKIVNVKREVILCAGVVESPHLLMLSGIGPENHLKQHGIPVIQNLPGVGKNLQNHPSVRNLAWTVPTGNSLNLMSLVSPDSISQYAYNRTGPLSVPFGVEGIAFMVGEKDPDWPEINIELVSVTGAVDNGLALYQLEQFIPGILNEYYEDIQGQQGFQLFPILMRPKSRGSITLKSSNPRDKPIVDPNLLSHPDDIRLLIKGIKYARSIGHTSALKDGLGAKFHSKPLPGCEHYVFESDEYLACFVRYFGTHTYHPAGTCKMGPKTDPNSVVDNRLRVRGVSGLRVIDASIMPLVVTGNLNAPCIMIGERGSDFIKEDYGVDVNQHKEGL